MWILNLNGAPRGVKAQSRVGWARNDIRAFSICVVLGLICGGLGGVVEVGRLVFTHVGVIYDVDITDDPPTLPLHGHHMERQLVAPVQPRCHHLGMCQLP